MRKVIFWAMIAIVVFLGAIIVVAAQKQVSPKVLVQGWFSRSSTGTTTNNDKTDDLHNAIQDKLNKMNSGKTTISASGELSDEDKTQVQEFLNSMVETN